MRKGFNPDWKLRLTVMGDPLAGGFPDMFLGVKLGSIRRQRQKLQMPILVSFQVGFDVLEMPGGTVPDKQRSLPLVGVFQLFQKLNRFCRVLPMGLAAVALAGFNVESSVEADGFPLLVKTNLRVVSGRIPNGGSPGFPLHPAFIRYQYHTILTGIPLESFFNVSSNRLMRWGDWWRFTLAGRWYVKPQNFSSRR